MKQIIQVDSKIDKEIEEHFSKKKFKLNKMINRDKLFKHLLEEVLNYSGKYTVNPHNSYEAGFENGYGIGYYQSLYDLAKRIKEW